MKTLLVISSIILLSFQVNRLALTSTDGDLIKSDVKVLNNKFLTNDNLTVIDSTYRSVKSIKKAAVVAKKAVSTGKTARKAVLQTNSKVLSRTYKANFSVQQNDNNKMLHKLIKDAEAAKAFTTVQFNYNTCNSVDTKAFNSILHFAEQLIFNPSLKISVAGFADNRGSENYNEQISWLRANQIKTYLLELGVSESQIIVSANGIADPVAENDSDAGRPLNRRVELAIVQY